MTAQKLDGAGVEKLKAIEEAFIALQAIHGLVERMGVEVKKQNPMGALPQQVRRHSGMLHGQLKGQFELIADQCAAMALASSRSGSDRVRLRTLREQVAQIRVSLELAARKVREQHAVEIELSQD